MAGAAQELSAGAPVESTGPVPLLSICIATLGRAATLRATLESIVPQIRFDAVELVIVDGGSRDATEDLVRSLMAESPRIRYHRLPEKGGVDNDYALSLRLARGEYCWFFCDDDLLEAGAVEAVCAALRQLAPELLVVNGKTWHAETDDVLEPRRLRIGQDRSFSPDQAEELFRTVAHHLSYIGAVVIRRALWLSRPHALYSGTEFAHVGMIFHAPLPGCAAILAEPLIRIRFMNHSWAPRAFAIWNLNWPRLIWSFEWITEGSRRSVVRRRPWRNTALLIVLRAKGHFDRDAYAKVICNNEPNLLHRALARFIASIPRRPLLGMVLGCYRLLVPWRKMGILELKAARLDT